MTDLTKITPVASIIEHLVISQFLYTKNLNDAAWQKSHFINTPWGIAWTVSPAGRTSKVGPKFEQSKEQAICILLLANIINWPELKTQINRTAKNTYKISAADAAAVANYWLNDQNIIDFICNTINTTKQKCNKYN